MKLITERLEDISYITETTESGEKKHFIEGIFLQAELKNKNGRIYPMKVMEREVGRYLKDIVENNRAYGELGHPQGPQINLDRVSHMIVKLEQNGSNFIGKARLTETPMGNLALGLLKSGANLGVSSRGMGTLKPTNEGIMEVQDDFRLATAADIVADPSAPDAFVKGIMEGVEYYFDAVTDSWKEERVDNMIKHMHTLTKKELEEQTLQQFKKFLDIISSR